MMKRLVVTAIVSLVCAVAASAACAREPVYVRAYGPYAQRPATLALWASDSLEELHWSGWGTRVATGVGKVTMHGIQTNYKYVLLPARVQLTHIARCDDRLVYLHVRTFYQGSWHVGHTDGCRVSG